METEMVRLHPNRKAAAQSLLLCHEAAAVILVARPETALPS